MAGNRLDHGRSWVRHPRPRVDPGSQSKSGSSIFGGRTMSNLHVWGAIFAIVVVSTTGDVLLSRAMKQIGDLGELRRSKGLLTVIVRVLESPSFLLGIFSMTLGFFSLLTGL